MQTKALKKGNPYLPSCCKAYRTGCSRWRDRVGARRYTLAQTSVRAFYTLFVVYTAFCITFPSKRGLWERKNVSRALHRVMKTLKFCYCWERTHIHTHSRTRTHRGARTNMFFWHSYKKDEFLRNLTNIFSFDTCLIQLPHNNILKICIYTKEKKITIYFPLSHEPYRHPTG